MNEQEKILLLQLILIDIRGNWGWEEAPRVPMALKLATSLGFEHHMEHIEDYDGSDGRHFRTSYKNGGYEGMSELHGLTDTICDKSDEFKEEAVKYLTFPDVRFSDWKEFKERD